jgi:hypothetical protein
MSGKPASRIGDGVSHGLILPLLAAAVARIGSVIAAMSTAEIVMFAALTTATELPAPIRRQFGWRG